MSPSEMQMRCYEEMAPLTERMLDLARGAQWAGLGPLEARFSALADELRQIPPQDLAREPEDSFLMQAAGAEPSQAPGDAARTLTPDEWRRRRAQLHARIQSNHRALRALVMPELARLAASLRSMEWQQSLQSTYSQPGRAWL